MSAAPVTSKAAAQKRPVVLVPCDNRMLGEHPFHVLGQKYADAVRDAAQCLPVLIPCTGQEDLDAYLDLADGVLLTGSPANVHPSHFGQDVRDPSLPLDPARDSVTLPLIRKVVERGLPMLGICRGLQEINVALGGTLHQAVQEVDGRMEHRGALGRPDAKAHEVYAPAHPIQVEPGSCLAGLVGASEITVNSVHGQGVDRLADGLVVEAHAPDGQVEAFRIAAHRGFALAVQWHPEWRALENPVSMQIFGAFGQACREQMAKRLAGQASALARAA
jgi:putative glutamine amidotransferase